ncbi:heme A synthase [Chloroflexota bacterium]
MNKFSKYAWFVAWYNIAVILWGAVVRATGSGAGCGNHWPKCNGQVLPQIGQLETAIEFTHRISSALSGILVIILVAWAFRKFQKGSAVRVWSVIAFILIFIEGWVGMVLVRGELVAANQSSERALVVALHLINTMLLLASLVITAWISNQEKNIQWQDYSKIHAFILVGIIATLLFNAAGAVTALGDTLFPPESLIEGLRQDIDPASNFLIQLRVLHPVLAAITCFYLIRVMIYLRNLSIGIKVERLFIIMFWLIGVQAAAGIINLLLLAPLFMQITHLFLANLFWLVLILIAINILTKPATE